MNKYKEALDTVIKIDMGIKHTFANYEYETNKEMVEIACEKAEAFDIIVNKSVDIDRLRCEIAILKNSFEAYNEYAREFAKEELTQEEFDLIKELLKNRKIY